MRARYVRFQRNDINVVAMLIAVVETKRKSKFVIAVAFDNGGRFLQQ